MPHKSKSPPSGTRGYTNLPRPAASNPSVPQAFVSLPSARAIATAPTPPAAPRASAGGLPSAVARLNGAQQRGNPPRNVRGGPLVPSKPASPVERRPSGVQKFKTKAATNA